MVAHRLVQRQRLPAHAQHAGGVGGEHAGGVGGLLHSRFGLRSATSGTPVDVPHPAHAGLDHVDGTRMVRDIHRVLLQRNEAEPTMEQTADAAGMSTADAACTVHMSRQPLSLDQPVGNHDDTYFGEFLQDYREDDPLLGMNHELLKARIADVLEGLDYRERKEIIRLRYGLADGYAYTLEEVGKIFSVTRERVRQIETKAVRSPAGAQSGAKVIRLYDRAVAAPLPIMESTGHDTRPWKACKGGWLVSP